MTNLASIDIGSHTARLLISRKVTFPGSFEPLDRRRAYIRLAEDFCRHGQRRISSDAIDRTVNALAYFARIIERYDVKNVNARMKSSIRLSNKSLIGNVKNGFL